MTPAKCRPRLSSSNCAPAGRRRARPAAAAAAPARRLRRHGPRRRVQEGAAQVHVRLQIGPLRPLVPGIDAHQRLPRTGSATAADQPRQPCLVQRGGRAVQHHAAALPPRVVVPARHRRADQRVLRRGLPRMRPPGHRHTNTCAVAAGSSMCRPSLQERQPLGQLVRRELDRGIHPAGRGSRVAEALRHHEHRVLARRPEQPPPALHRRRRVRDQPRRDTPSAPDGLQPDVAAGRRSGARSPRPAPARPGAVVLGDQHLAGPPRPSAGSSSRSPTSGRTASRCRGRPASHPAARPAAAGR